MILNTAFDIARISGLDKVSNREIAKRLNCSIRPIYYQFRDVQEMNSELIKKIWQYFYDYIFTKRDENIPDYKKTGINYIDFACNEKELFKILFMIVIVVSCYVRPNILWNLCDYFIAFLAIINVSSIIKICGKME